MKKLLVSAALLSLFITGSAIAFGGGKAHNMHREMKHLMMESLLDLSDEQKASIKAIRKEYRGEKRKGYRQHSEKMELFSLDPASSDYQNKLEELAKRKAQHVEQKVLRRGQMHADMFAILTPEQQEKFRELHKEMHERVQAKTQ